MTTPESAIPNAQVMGDLPQSWGLTLTPAGCPACQQAHLIPQHSANPLCPNCARSALTPQPARLRPEPPEMIIPFRITSGQLQPILQKFCSQAWLKPDDLNPTALLQRAAAVFIPLWLVDGTVYGEWQAEAGYDYQVKSSQEYYSGGGWQTRELVETRTRWEPRLGQIARRYNNIAAPATSDYARLVQRIGEFPIQQAAPYSPELAKGCSLRVPDLPPESALPLAQSALQRSAAAECQAAAGSQHIRNVMLNASYESLHWTQLLMPVYFTYYTGDDGQPNILTINGVSGRIGGRCLASQRKGWQWAGILAAAAAALFILGFIGLLLGSILPPVAALGLLAVIAAFICAIAAVLPAVYPWQHNRSQQE